MSAVVRRCPNCGTTQPDAGECEACHEAAVRYFCPNHTPGRWLDAPACEACGARFGVDAPPPRPAPRPTPPPAPPRRTPAPAPRPAPRPAATRDPDPLPPVGGGFDAYGRPRRDARRAPAELPPPPAPPRRTRRADAGLPGGLRARLGGGLPATLPPALPGAIRAGTRSAFGCLGRLVMTVVVLAVLLGVGLLWLFGTNRGARDWAVDVGQQVGVVEGVPEQTRRGIAAYRRGDRASAERELAEAARAYPRSALALVYLARMRLDAGADFAATQRLAEAYRREPDEPVVRQAVAEYGCALVARDPDNAQAADLAARAGARCPDPAASAIP